MENRTWLQIPGPTNIPARILARLAEPMINHRGPRFARLLSACADGLRRVMRTGGDVLLFPSSGTGMLESAIVNLFSPGDTIVAASMGVFSERMAGIAEAHGVRVARIVKRWGSAVEPEDVVKILADDPGRRIAAVCLPHAETSTGVTNDLAAIRAAARATGHPALFIVDAVSSLACLPLETDAWGLDVVLSASQKGLMLPPGLGIAAVAKAAWERIGASTMPRWYWDYGRVRDCMAGGQLPYTPATALLVGLEESLRMIEEETLEGVWQRHAAVASAVRDWVRDLGLVAPARRAACLGRPHRGDASVTASSTRTSPAGSGTGIPWKSAGGSAN